MPVKPTKPEVMSPAGYWPQVHAAVEAGADSIYFGLTHFTARAKVGFALSELPDLMRTLHGRGVRGFVTFNTLVFDHELAEAARAIAAIAEAGADALIVQDLAVMKLARTIAPELELHASTQMSITSADGVRLAQELGASRITLARELSLEEIRAIRANTDAELEIFVHGALCVAYSGQCFSSEAWGGRSANRGQCAQACRLPYELIVDDVPVPLDEARYLLSPGDLYTLPHVPEIVAAGVSALKIEGRYKDAEYVALTTRAYRKAVDDAWEGTPSRPSAEEELQLESVYSRGLGPFFLSGTNHQRVVRGRSPRHRGVLMGKVARIVGNAALIEPADAHAIAPLKAGDGVVFDSASWRSPQEAEEGGRIFEAHQRPDGLVTLRFGRDGIDFSRIRGGDLLWRTDDAATHRAARPYTSAASPIARQALNVEVSALEGQPLRTLWMVAGNTATRISLESPQPLQRGENQLLDTDAVVAQFGRLGGTPYRLGEIRLHTEGRPFAPASVLNGIRREAIERLQALQTERVARPINEPSEALSNLRKELPEATARAVPVQLHLLVRSPAQLEAALESSPDSITLDYLDLYGLKPSVDRVKAAGIPVRVASPRILKPGEEKIADFLLRLEAPILVRSAGLLQRWRGIDRVLTGDFSLNAANALTARFLLRHGLDRLTPGHDLNGEQVAALAREAGASRIEAVAWGHMPVFHTEHCVFCRFLSTGTTYKDCGRPCESHMVALRDDSGREHPVLADTGCRNTVFSGPAQEASLHLENWLAGGICHFRLEFAHENAAEVRGVTAVFRRALRRSIRGRQLTNALREYAPQGTTEGSLFVPKEHEKLTVLQ